MYNAQVSTRVAVARASTNGNSNTHLLNHLPFIKINQFSLYRVQLIKDSY